METSPRESAVNNVSAEVLAKGARGVARVPVSASHYPGLYQINTRIWMTELSRSLGRAATLDDVPDASLDAIAKLGLDWVWLLSVWQTGRSGQQVSRTNRDWRRDFAQTLPDLREDDIAGSGFALIGYSVNSALGGDDALARLRERLRSRGLRLMLDFVPNHTALDHPWVELHPDYYVQGTEADLARAPQNYIRLHRARGDLVLAHGRDPYFPGWPDTLQLDYSRPATQMAMKAELAGVAERCDGVRCDMAMLILPDVFERTWGRRALAFWPDAIRQARSQTPTFCLMAEVYWDLEWTMMQVGFDYAYDKRLYDRLRDGHARPVREHLCAGLEYQSRLARFLENHDEPRAASTFERDKHQAAAIITYLSPGLRFFQEGQFEGRMRQISPHLVRRPDESSNVELSSFYERLRSVLHRPLVHEGTWRLLECVPAWDGNWTYDCFIAWTWQGADGERLLIVVNYAANQSQCYVRWPFNDAAGRAVHLTDLLGSARFERGGSDLVSKGLYVDLPPWGYHVLSVTMP